MIWTLDGHNVLKFEDASSCKWLEDLISIHWEVLSPLYIYVHIRRVLMMKYINCYNYGWKMANVKLIWDHSYTILLKYLQESTRNQYSITLVSKTRKNIILMLFRQVFELFGLVIMTTFILQFLSSTRRMINGPSKSYRSVTALEYVHTANHYPSLPSTWSIICHGLGDSK